MSRHPPDSRPDKRWVGRSFGSAAHGYERVAGLQRAVGARLLSLEPDRARQPAVIVDVGTGTGYFAAELTSLYPASRLIALDIAEGMLQVARERFGASDSESCHCVCGDAEALPLADRSVDLIFSNLAIQWCANLVGVFREFHRVLKPEGIALFSTFGAQTLSELRKAWAAVDAYSHVNVFADADTVATALRDSGFAEIGLETEMRTLEYNDVHGLMHELKGLGAHNVTANRPRHLTGKKALQTMVDAYAAHMGDGVIRASFETIYGCVGGNRECP